MKKQLLDDNSFSIHYIFIHHILKINTNELQIVLIRKLQKKKFIESLNLKNSLQNLWNLNFDLTPWINLLKRWNARKCIYFIYLCIKLGDSKIASRWLLERRVSCISIYHHGLSQRTLKNYELWKKEKSGLNLGPSQCTLKKCVDIVNIKALRIFFRFSRNIWYFYMQ